VAGDPADHDPAEDEGDDRHEAAETGQAAALTGLGHIGAAQDGVTHDAGNGVAGDADRIFSAGACGASDLLSRPTHDRLRSLPRGRIAIDSLAQVNGSAK